MTYKNNPGLRFKGIGTRISTLAEKPKYMDDLKGLVNKPEELDQATDKLGIAPSLMNLKLATPADLSFLNIGLGEAVYLPQQITEKAGGRKSAYRLAKGESTTPGVFITGQGMLQRVITRMTGESCTAKSGDIYREQYLTMDGKLVYEAAGVLEIEDETNGIGKYELHQTDTAQYAVKAGSETEVWVIFSMIRVRHKKTKIEE